ncbi:MAG: hypothetical protein PF450_02505 [Bacteroidales bacterium]|nr:hypothetical protein [Bacteroidales bacterium]
MKKIIPVILAVLILSSCASITKHMQRGNYDKVIFKTTKKLIRKPNAKDAQALDRAYKLAKERDLERITFLEREDNPDYYDELFARYATLKERQAKVRTVMPLTVDGRTYNYEYIDYDAKIVASKNKAAEEFYRNGKQLITNAFSKLDFREANHQLLRANEYGGHNFPDIDELIHESRMMGISRVIVVPENRDPNIGIPQIDLEYLISFDTRNLEANQWTEYHFKHVGGNVNYDYEMFVRVLSINVSDNIEKESKEEFKKKSTTEFDYALDVAGNVMKDTSGNDIKIYKDVFATIIKREKIKTAIIRGEVEIISIMGEPKGSLAKIPFTGEDKFENISYDLIGNPQAVPPPLITQAKNDPLPFPTETILVKGCIENAKPAVQSIVLDTGNRYIK